MAQDQSLAVAEYSFYRVDDKAQFSVGFDRQNKAGFHPANAALKFRERSLTSTYNGRNEDCLLISEKPAQAYNIAPPSSLKDRYLRIQALVLRT
ncbi:hypothetical protein SAMN05443244_0970 [Terriglobus roseus]|uniref:Uncharacterized protein n=1 Tax=Terriglobus roseus TaxID=392734 RepID=A0A1H4K2J2_9BACT|nr:hypothetical protein SAMN05443244_0970 [Terriglobus roseus]